jgi:hypothetical protein
MSITFDSDEHIERFRNQSDQAFLAMQARCDQEMERFLQSYSDGSVKIGSFQTPAMQWGTASLPQVQSAVTTAKRKLRDVAAKAGERAEKIAGRRARAEAARGGAMGGLEAVGQDLKQDLMGEGAEAVEEAKGWLKSATMDLGERARREAAAMREAARKAMQEETSLRGLKERAKQELEAAKARMKSELQDVAADAMQDLEGLAIGKLSEVQEHGFDAAEATQRRVSLELGDLLDGDNRR